MKKKRGKKLTLLPSLILLLRSFFSLFFSRIACMETTREAKTPLYRASSDDDVFLESMCSSFFCYALKRTSLHTLFSYFLACLAYTLRPKQKESATSFSFSLVFLHIYATKVISSFFFSRTISLTAKVYDKQWMASESNERKELILLMI